VSRDALASVYADILENEYFRRTVAEHPEVLGDFDLTDAEKKALKGEVGHKAKEIVIGDGPVMKALHHGPTLSPGVALRLGAALNRAAGLPVGALNGPGFLSNAACCPWGHAVIGDFGIDTAA
jgi:hypothetical protein